jgi:hypothetical protein
MRIRELLLSAALALSVNAQSTGEASDKSAILDRVRQYAASCIEKLQDFTCLQITVRSADTSGTGRHWKVLETQEQELSYIAHKESYRLLSVDGDSINPQKKLKHRYTSMSGEFGSSLRAIFDPVHHAEFNWDHSDANSCVFHYHVPLESSAFTWAVLGKRLKLGYSGLVDTDCGTGAVKRLQLKTDPSANDVEFQSDVHYGLITIGGREFILPVSALDISRVRKTLTKAVLTFDRFRKYDSNSSIKFED